MPLENVTRKLKLAYFDSSKIFFRFDGTTFKNEPSSKFSHRFVMALGSYRDSPFVTGNYASSTTGLKTEILNYNAQQWFEAKDYPFSKGDT